MLEFEWDDAKALTNMRAHGVAFHEAVKAFRDPFAVEHIDSRQDCGEERVNLIGTCDASLIHVTYTQRAERIRLIRLVGRKNMNKTTTIARIRTDGTVTKVLRNGREKPFRPTRMRAMSQGQVRNAAAADPDARPMTAAHLRKAERVPRVKTLRRALGLTQEEFATRYHIPVGTLRDWEQGRSEPDQPAKAFLQVIARDPDHVYNLLSSERR